MSKNELTKYFCSYDRTFISDRFQTTFTNKAGEKIDGDIAGASIYIAVIPVKKGTGESIYNTSENNKELEEKGYGPEYFGATIHPTLGAIVIPNAEHMMNTLPNNIELAGKIVGYTIDIYSSPYMISPINVEEKEFVRVISENYEKFNIPDSYHAQTTSYDCHIVNVDDDRNTYRVGYNAEGLPVIEEAEKTHSVIKDFFSIARTLEEAKQYEAVLKQITPEKMNEIIYDANRNHPAIKDILELAKTEGESNE